MTNVSDETLRLLRTLFERPSLIERLRGRDPRLDTLVRIAASREFRAVPTLLVVMAFDESLALHVARTIAELLRGIGPSDLAWIDEHARRPSVHGHNEAWTALSPRAVSRLARAADFDPTVVGVLASHPNGFVRAAALEVLGRMTDGRELPFLALRANDWVAPVAARAAELMMRRLRSGSGDAILDALPFVARLMAQRRHEHGEFAPALTSALLSDGGDEALARSEAFDRPVRRFLFGLIWPAGAGLESRLVRAALIDHDFVVRARAVDALKTDPHADGVAVVLERLLQEDPVPAVRRRALSALSERLPSRIPALLPSVLLDRAASVRRLARFVAATHHVPLVPREVYVENLMSTAPRRLAAAIDGLGEVGTRADVDRLTPFLHAATPRTRRAALRAAARLDVDRAIPSVIAALTDDSAAVRAAAAHIVAMHPTRVDFHVVYSRLRTLPDPRARQLLLPLLRSASKWDAAVFLLQGLGDPDTDVRTTASSLLDVWVAVRLPDQAARFLRFSVKEDAVR